MSENNENQMEELDINHLMQIRRDKLKELQEQGKDPFEIYKQIYERKMLPHDKTSIEFYNSLNSFNIFKTRCY